MLEKRGFEGLHVLLDENVEVLSEFCEVFRVGALDELLHDDHGFKLQEEGCQ